MFNKIKTYEFSMKGLELAKKDNKKFKDNRIMDLIMYSTLLGLTIGNMMHDDTLFKITACDCTKRVVKYFIH